MLLDISIYPGIGIIKPEKTLKEKGRGYNAPVFRLT
jgi:hypothetical protein